MKTFTKSVVAAGLIALIAGPALAYEPGTFILRGGVGTIDPKSHSLKFSDGIDDVTISVDRSTSMTLTGTYMINENWAIDVLAALPFKHDIKATVDVGAGPETAKIADTKQLPPTVSFQYHFKPDADFQPYVGLGLNWTRFSDTKLVSGMIDEDVNELCLDNSLGVAAQFGGDWKVGERTVVNLDVRWIDIDSDISVAGAAFDGKEKIGTAQIDPWSYALSLGYRF
jgi:outer membrane protein